MGSTMSVAQLNYNRVWGWVARGHILRRSCHWKPSRNRLLLPIAAQTQTRIV